jgi:hypothetical protein
MIKTGKKSTKQGLIYAHISTNPCSEIYLTPIKSRYYSCVLGVDKEFLLKEEIRKNRDKIINDLLYGEE